MADFVAQHLSEIAAAAERIAPYVRRTPILPTDLSPDLVVKPECLQVTGAFKARGAFNALLCQRQRDPGLRGVIAVSSGNHAQAVALAAKILGVKAVVLIPADSNLAKIAATRALGAEVITEGVTAENRDALLRQTADERGLSVIHPFDDWDVIHGQGTAGYELFQDRPDIRLVVTPVGGGGLISGTTLAAKGHDPNTRIIGVEPETAADAAASLHSGQHQSLPGPPRTIADGVRTLSIGQRPFEVIVGRRLVEDIVTVSEDEIEHAVLVAAERLKLAVEPTGALPLAAYLAGKLPRGQPTALLISGGNADRAVIARIFGAA